MPIPPAAEGRQYTGTSLDPFAALCRHSHPVPPLRIGMGPYGMECSSCAKPHNIITSKTSIRIHVLRNTTQWSIVRLHCWARAPLLLASLGCILPLPGPGGWGWTQQTLHCPVLAPTTGALMPVPAVDEPACAVIPGVAHPLLPVP